MVVPMMRIRKMVMRVSYGLMPVSVSVSSAGCDGRIVLVAMVFVMDMLVLVFQRVMNMFVLVPLAQVQPDTAISVPAANNRGLMASPSITASTAPRNGATEK